MQTQTTVPPSDNAGTEEGAFWRALLYRWFVEYNPLYLLSAALVLAGCLLWSRGLAHEESLAGPLGIAFVAELYGASLALGAALLTRIGFRRPAVMLALIAVFYQWDATLHTETCAYLGLAGASATAVWFLMFVAKLYLLGWALRVRFAGRVVIAAIVAAAGLALGPRVLPGLGGRNAGIVLALWLFALGSLYRPGGIKTLTPLDDWGTKVLRRVTRASWIMSGTLVASHVLMWWKDHDIGLSAAFLAAPLLAVPRVRRERTVWVTVFATLGLSASAQPSAFFGVALLAAAALCLRALAPAFASAAESPPADLGSPSVTEPYRASNVRESNATPAPGPMSPVLSYAQRVRSLVGALFAVHLAVWTFGWTGGPWPPHVLALDAGLTVVVLLAAWRTRVRSTLVPLAAWHGHLLMAHRLLPMPTSSAAWGETTVALGFALLAASLFTSYRLRTYNSGGDTG
jgi:hypothetical protein